MKRKAAVTRKTRETDVAVEINLDGTGAADIASGIGFFDHMLHHLARHSLCDLTVKANGDLQVDFHHTVEDLGITLGQAFAKALGDKTGINRYGSAAIPMDEALVQAALDLSGRPELVYELKITREKIGDFDTELAKEFFRAFVVHAGMNLHLHQQAGSNGHHILEAAFKAVARALRQAVSMDEREKGVPSTKGIL
ncbi:MAG: imidazoleglycerol-phosphate dehydratase HisB [Bacillota bacterium]